jgi:hypothetical protein
MADKDRIAELERALIAMERHIVDATDAWVNISMSGMFTGAADDVAKLRKGLHGANSAFRELYGLHAVSHTWLDYLESHNMDGALTNRHFCEDSADSAEENE